MIFDLMRWNMFWYLFLACLFLRRGSLGHKYFTIFYLNLGLQLGLRFIAVIFNSDPTVIYTASHRLLSQVLPLAALVLCINLSDNPELKLWKNLA